MGASIFVLILISWCVCSGFGRFMQPYYGWRVRSTAVVPPPPYPYPFANNGNYLMNNRGGVTTNNQMPCQQTNCRNNQCGSNCGGFPCQSNCRRDCQTTCGGQCGQCGTGRCGTSCQINRPTSYCDYFPCYSQNVGGYEGYNPINRNNYPQQPTDPYANVPVEIIDVDDMERPISKGVGQSGSSDSTHSSGGSTKPKVTTSSQSSYSASGGPFVTNSTVQAKPISATISRTFTPSENNVPADINIVNGKEITTVAPEITTTLENEEPEDLSSWLG